MKTREINIDYIRVYAVFGVVILHILGGLNVENLSGKNYVLYTTLLWISYCSVNLFGMISGYLKVDHQQHFHSILKIWFQTFFLCLLVYLFTLFFLDIYPGIGYFVFPFLNGRLWYVSCYSFVFLASPYFNIVANNMSYWHYKLFIGVFFVLLSIIPMMYGDVFQMLNHGYSAAWLSFMYFIGGFFKRYKNEGLSSIKNKYIPIIVILCSLLFFVLKHIVHDDYHKFYYNSPIVVINSILIFYFFLNLKLEKYKIINRIIVFLSTLSFGIYVIHAHPFFLDYVFTTENLEKVLSNNVIISMFNILFLVVLIVLVSGICDLFRFIIFRYIGINKVADILGDRIDKKMQYNTLIK